MQRSVLVAAIGAMLLLAPPAYAHVIASPGYVAQGATQTIELSVPNERDAPMTSFVVTAPPGLEIVSAGETKGWDAAVKGQTASWSGGSLPSKLSETFDLRVRANVEPGTVELEAVQLYRDGKVRWPVSLTIVPGSSSSTVVSNSSRGSGKLIVALAAIGLLVAAGVALVAWRRRA